MALFNKNNKSNFINVAQVQNIKKALTKIIKSIKHTDAIDEITPEQLYRSLRTIQEWHNAVDSAENVTNPDKYDLIEIFNQIVDDYMVYSVMQQRTTKVINSKLMFINPDGSENEEIKEFFLNPDGTQKPWFRHWLKIAQEVKYYGFEVVQLGPVINGEFKTLGPVKAIEKIPEQNLVPFFRVIKKSAQAGLTPSNCINIDFSDFSPWLVAMGDEKNLGLLNKVVPWVLFKTVFANWRQHAEIFAQPLRQGKTDIYDNERVRNMAKMFEDMAASTWAIIHPDDDIQFIETSKTDAYNIYDKLIDRCDKAIQMIFLSQTGTTEEKAFTGSTQAHERTLDRIVLSDRLDISEYFNEILLPKLKRLGIISESINISLVWISDETASLTQWADIIAKLSLNYEIPEEEINRLFNLNVTARLTLADKQSPERLKNINNLLNTLNDVPNS